MKILIPFRLSQPVQGQLMFIGYGQLTDHSARRFTLYRDLDHSRLVLHADGLPENQVVVFDAKALAVALGGDEIPGDALDYVAQVDVLEETRQECPLLVPMLSFDDGKLELLEAINGWCVASRRDSRVVNLDVIHLATRVVQACSCLSIQSAPISPEPDSEPQPESAETGATAPGVESLPPDAPVPAPDPQPAA